MVSIIKSSARGRIATGVLAAALAGAFLAGPAFAADVDAEALWKKNCQTCHGPDGKGKTKSGEKAKVKDLTSAEIKAKYDRAKVLDAIKNGVKEEGSDKMAMKPYGEKLSAPEIEALTDYTLALK